ncbi:MAG: PTS sugar transporter subunit IIA [Desulfobacteraceae bacterium]|jgi:Trk K+ transport system NAD-binding subunit/Kef-type K+ transport system membrane component KefB/mannitol/fructose-specific phosphotransferase system IIA component (Ntr-type)
MDVLIFIVVFTVISLAAKQIGVLLANTGLPLISGFLFTGVLCGPFLLDLISIEAVTALRFVDEIALGIIAFAAGSELYFKELKHRLRDIAWTITGLVVSTFSLSSIAFFMLTPLLSFSAEMGLPFRVGISLMAGSIFVARSPSSAIAIVNELRARGPFVQTVLGVTVIMDVLVITLFSTNLSIADALFTGLRFNLGFLLLLIIELGGSLIAGLLVYWVLTGLLYRNFSPIFKLFTIPFLGYLVFEGSAAIRSFTHARLPFEVLLEPLLICMIAGFATGNNPKLRKEFHHLLSRIGPPVYIAFFTLTGASLSLNILAHTWHVALILFFVRVFAIFAGSFLGGTAAGLPAKQNTISWMAYITQAGVGLGLAREVVVEFPEWGASFATIIIAVIFLNQILGPPLFKWAIRMTGEDHPKAQGIPNPEFQNVLILGSGKRAFTLYQSLVDQGWTVTLAIPDRGGFCEENPDGIPFITLPVLDLDSLVRVGADNVSAIVVLLSEKENYRVCELAWEHLGTQTLVAMVDNPEAAKKFEALGVLVVEPANAVIHLMDYFVRSPVTASLLSSRNGEQKLAELSMMNPQLAGMAIRDAKLPIDTLILSIRRNNQVIVPYDYTRLALGDRLSLLGSFPALRSAALRFGANAKDALSHMVERAVPLDLGAKPDKKEVRQVIDTPESSDKKRFLNLIRTCDILDFKKETEIEGFFKSAAAALCSRLDQPPSALVKLMQKREAEASTILAPGLAVPHIIVPGKRRFELLPVRAKKGIIFNPDKSLVHTAFVLAGTRDERDFHLYALSAIAKMALDTRFEQKLMRAAGKRAMRRILISSSGVTDQV